MEESFLKRLALKYLEWTYWGYKFLRVAIFENDFIFLFRRLIETLKHLSFVFIYFSSAKIFTRKKVRESRVKYLLYFFHFNSNVQKPRQIYGSFVFASVTISDIFDTLFYFI